MHFGVQDKSICNCGTICPSLTDDTFASLTLVGLVVEAGHAAWDAAAKPETSDAHNQADQPSHV